MDLVTGEFQVTSLGGLCLGLGGEIRNLKARSGAFITCQNSEEQVLAWTDESLLSYVQTALDDVQLLRGAFLWSVRAAGEIAGVCALTQMGAQPFEESLAL